MDFRRKLSNIFLAVLMWILANVLADKYPLLKSVPETHFSCYGRLTGYYADPHPSTRCQVYHMCGLGGRKYSYLCPNHTLFDQERMICNHWYRVNCTDIESRYRVNENLFPDEKVKSTSRRKGDKKSFLFSFKKLQDVKNNCSGCLKHFMKDKKSCTPCVVPR